MINRLFVDSSILVEYLKGSRTNLFDELLRSPDVDLYVNETVVSEFLLYFLMVNGKASARSLKEANKISGIYQSNTGYNIINRFVFLSNDDGLFKLVPAFMSKYNLLPNDAIILATCKLHGITKLASHDVDFVVPCREEGIELPTE